MATPPPSRAARKRPRSPKEDGEIGETAQDVLMRHPLLTPGERRLVKALREYEDELTPDVARSMGRMLSAALSPMPQKLEPKDAKEALEIIATKVLQQRRQQRCELAEAEARELRQRQREAAAAVEAENMTRGAAAVARRPTVGSPKPPPRQERDNHGYMRDK